VNIVSPPSRELLRLVTRVDFASGRLAASRQAALDTEWEAPRHAWCLSNLALRHEQAVLTLARTDQVLVPAAWAAARAAMEAAGRALWLTMPEDPWVRERRWLVFVDESARFHERMATEANSGQEEATGISNFAAEVRALLPRGDPVHGIPSTTEMLTPYGKGLPTLYALCSQYVHGADAALSQWRSGLGTTAAYGQQVESCEFATPISIAWQAFRATAVTLMRVCGVKADFDLEALDAQIRAGREELEATRLKGDGS